MYRFGNKAGGNLCAEILIVRHAIPICTAPVARQIKRRHLKLGGHFLRQAYPRAGMGQ